MSSNHPTEVTARRNEQLTTLLDALTNPDDLEISEFALNLIARTDDVDRLAAFVFSAWARMRRAGGDVNVSMLRSVTHRLGVAAEASKDVRCAFDYLLLWAEVVRYFKRNRLRFATSRDIFAQDHHVAGISNLIQDCEPALSTAYGRLMFEAMVASGTSRSRAAELFRGARTECPALAAALDLDHFASTYFSVEQIHERASENAERRATLGRDFEYILEPAVRGGGGHSIQLLFSCDPAYFTTYFPYWLSVASWLWQLDVRMHFVITAERSEAFAVVESALELADAMARFRGVDPSKLRECISFSSVPVPSWIPNPKTFYACARYLFASSVGSRFEGRLLVVDIDTRMTRDPTDFFQYLRQLSSTQIALVSGRGISCLIPARRFMGSSFLVPHLMSGGSAMRHIEDYMCAGLSSPTSWTLDQGAIDYLIQLTAACDRHENVVDLTQRPRPFAQEPVRRFYRAGVRQDDA